MLSLFVSLPFDSQGATQKLWEDGILNKFGKYKHGITDKSKICNYISLYHNK